MSPVVRLITVVLLSTQLGCGEGVSTPGGPTEPSPSAGQANVLATGSLTFQLCDGPGGGCSYSQVYTNTGSGCANNLHGRVRIYADDTLLETDEWWLDPTLRLTSGASTTVEDCCFSQDTVRRRTRSVAETFWNNIPCD